MLEKIEGIVIKTQDYGETHKIITIFTKEMGKLTALCRGANRPRSRMAALAQPFIKGQFLIYLSKGLSTVQQGEIIKSFRTLREDIFKTAYAAYIIELTDKLTDPKQKDVFLYDQLVFTLNRINDSEDIMIPIIMLELKLFKKGGFGPFVEHCLNCKGNIYPFSFSIREGGFLCGNCVHLDEHAISLPNSLAKLFPIFLNVGLERIGNINIKRDNQLLLRQIFDAYYEQYGGYYLKSKRFLKQLNLLEE